MPTTSPLTLRRLTLFSLFTLLLSLLLNTFRPTMPTSPSPFPERQVQPGDSLIPNPEMLYVHSTTIAAPIDTIFPWVLQLGKGRGGWYLPRSWERVLPRSMHAAREVREEWIELRTGDLVEDYGFDKEEDVFEVMQVIDGKGDGERALVYQSERYGTVFTWAILVRSLIPPGQQELVNGRGDDPGIAGQQGPLSQVTLRFRGRIQRTGWQRKMLVVGGGWMDWATTWPMLRGLKERCEEEYRRR